MASGLKRLLAVPALLGLTACPKTCRLEDFARLDVGATDCGSITFASTAAASKAAQACALGAAAGGHPFRVIWQVHGMDSNLRWALEGTGTVLHFIQWDGDVTGGSKHLDWRQQIHESSCASVAVRAGCVATADDLCLDCVGETAPALLCSYR